MFETIRTAIFKNALGKLIAGQKRRRTPHTLESARSVGVLFDASTETSRKEVRDFLTELEKAGKKVRSLGYFNQKQAPESPGFDSFALKDSTWAGIPKSEKARAFMEEKLDLLLSFNPDDYAQMAWVAAASQANMKIGAPSRRMNDFDIQLEIPTGKGFTYFMEQLRIYLDKIVLTKP